MDRLLLLENENVEVDWKLNMGWQLYESSGNNVAKIRRPDYAVSSTTSNHRPFVLNGEEGAEKCLLHQLLFIEEDSIRKTALLAWICDILI